MTPVALIGGILLTDRRAAASTRATRFATPMASGSRHDHHFGLRGSGFCLRGVADLSDSGSPSQASKKLTGLWQRLPSLQVADDLIYRATSFGVAMLL